MVKGDIAVYYTERHWGDELSGGGDRKRIRYSNADIPSCLFCVFGSSNIADLERHLVKWMEMGCPERFSVDGKFVRTRDGWLEDLEVKPGAGGDEVPDSAVAYSKDFLEFFGPRERGA